LGLKLAVTNARGYAVNFDRPAVELPEAPLMDAQSRSAMTVFGDTLRLSGTVGEASAHPLLKRWYHLIPDIMSQLAPAREIWSGLRPLSPMGRPYISGTSIPGLWVNTGHGHMGWTLCAGSADLMADMVLEGREDNRFAYAG
jgi:D-amino-acid dehydrogenase